jgi:hypothetical protein
MSAQQISQEREVLATAKCFPSAGWVLNVFECPYCDGQHRHTGGKGDLPIFKSLTPPCSSGDSYLLVELY